MVAGGLLDQGWLENEGEAEKLSGISTAISSSTITCVWRPEDY
jgi:hypothetical protein